jgi:hypothetical protein
LSDRGCGLCHIPRTAPRPKACLPPCRWIDVPPPGFLVRLLSSLAAYGRVVWITIITYMITLSLLAAACFFVLLVFHTPIPPPRTTNHATVWVVPTIQWLSCQGSNPTQLPPGSYDGDLVLVDSSSHDVHRCARRVPKRVTALPHGAHRNEWRDAQNGNPSRVSQFFHFTLRPQVGSCAVSVTAPLHCH